MFQLIFNIRALHTPSVGIRYCYVDDNKKGIAIISVLEKI